MSDIWAVGAVLHIMLTYETPTQDQPRGLIARISKLDSLRPMDRAPTSELLSLVVGECLSPSEKDRPSALQLLAVAMKSDCSLESYQRSESFWQVMATDADSELSSMVVARFVYKHLPIMAKHRIRFSPKEIVLIMNLTYRYCRSHLTSCHQNLCSGFLDGSAGDLTGGTVFHALVCLQRDDDLLLQTLQDDNWPSAKELSTCALKKNREGLLPSALAAKAQSNALYVWMEANE